ncbi:MAG: hypothetical protein IPN29_14025 [Saprospiraceae bacterium]|nr:hypothetical protein [Saprospiraceae bacterium]
MRKIPCLLLLVFLILFFSCKTTKPVVAEKSFVFPADWIGHWTGMLSIFNEGRKSMEVPMQCLIQPAENQDEYHWTLVYGHAEKEDRRDYVLKASDAKKGHYLIDELNSILLDACVLDNKLISAFTVQNNALTSVYTRQADQLIFEIYMHMEKNPSVTGGAVVENDTIPEVKSYKTRVYQKALLQKAKK